jgi:hypothetical protein
MTHRELSARVDRLTVAIAELSRELDDNGPRLMPCNSPGCRSMTRYELCLMCRTKEKRKIEKDVKR